MKKLNFFIFSVIVFCLFAFKSYAENSIVFLDIEKAVNDSNIGKKILTDLNNTRLNEINKLKIIEKKLKDKDIEINKVKNIISKEELEIKVNDLRNEINQFNQKKDEIQKNFISNKNKQLDELFKKINPLIIQYMDDNSIDMIIGKNNVYLAKSTLDITEKIILLINNKLN